MTPPPGDDPAILDALARAFRDGSWGDYRGPHLPALTDALKRHFQVEEAFPVASGTLACEAAFCAANVQPGDEVILAAYDYEANFLNVHALGATPVLVDVLPNGAAIDSNLLDAARSPKTKALIISHLHGCLADVAAIRDFADRTGVVFVEDAAQAPGATIGGSPVGSFGDVAVLSFGGSKLLRAGRGGALLCRRADLAQRARLWLKRGVQDWGILSELQAIVLLPQLESLSEAHRERLGVVRHFSESIADGPGVSLLQPLDDAGLSPAYYKLGLWFDPEAYGRSRADFVAELRAAGIAIDVGFRALHVGRSPSRFRAAGALSEAARGERVVKLHHTALRLGTTGVDLVAQAIATGYRNAL